MKVNNSRDSSGDNETEITNIAIGDSVVDSATIHWKKHPKFHGLSDKEIEKLTLAQYEEHEATRMENNAWVVVSN